MSAVIGSGTGGDDGGGGGGSGNFPNKRLNVDVPLSEEENDMEEVFIYLNLKKAYFFGI